MAYTDNVTALNAVTSTTTSSAYDVSMREKVSFVMTCANHTSGNGVFSVDGSNDGVNWVTGLAFQDATSTAATTFVTGKTLSSNTTAGGYFPFNPFKLIRFVCTVTTDGTYTLNFQTYGG